jgi:sugar/nucleoside kinase (ribokinase family)
VTRVLVVGDIVTDIVALHRTAIAADSDTPARITQTGGGAGANTAAWLAFAGAPVGLLGVIGDDAAGATRLAELTTAGVDCSLVRRTRERPTGTVIVLSDGAHRSMLTDRGANHELTPSDVDLSGVDHLHVSGYTLLDETTRPAGLRALSLAREHGVPVSVDAASSGPLRRTAGFLDWIAGVDLLFANLDEARVLAGSPDADPAAVAAALAGTVREVVVKAGPGGATWSRGGSSIALPAAGAGVVDTTGAGDAFAAGFLAARLRRAGVEAALAAGINLGTRAVGLVGGRPPGVAG